MSTINPYNGNTDDNSSAPKGSASNPYTEEEFYSMLDAGTWEGGYVENRGYCLPDVVIQGSHNDSFDDSWGSDVFGSNNEPPTPPTPPTPDDGEGGANSGKEEEDEASSYDLEKTLEYLINNANKTSTGRCARAIRLALEAGGLSTTGRPNSACDYDTFLPSLGFYEVGKTNYSPQAGDIIVIEAVEGHPHGHIAMYSGEQWISDFRQRDMWGGIAYRNKAEYTLFRK